MRRLCRRKVIILAVVELIFPIFTHSLRPFPSLSSAPSHSHPVTDHLCNSALSVTRNSLLVHMFVYFKNGGGDRTDLVPSVEEIRRWFEKQELFLLPGTTEIVGDESATISAMSILSFCLIKLRVISILPSMELHSGKLA